MRIKVYYIVLFICGILMSSCQKEDSITQPHIESQLRAESLAINSTESNESIQNLEGNKAADCTDINSISILFFT